MVVSFAYPSSVLLSSNQRRQNEDLYFFYFIFLPESCLEQNKLKGVDSKINILYHRNRVDHCNQKDAVAGNKDRGRMMTICFAKIPIVIWKFYIL